MKSERAVMGYTDRDRGHGFEEGCEEQSMYVNQMMSNVNAGGSLNPS